MSAIASFSGGLWGWSVPGRSSRRRGNSRRGIDDRIYFHDEADDRAATKQIVLSVKAGKIRPDHVRDLRGVVDREGAAIGVLISMQEPTQHTRSEAASAGFFESANLAGRRCRRISPRRTHWSGAGHCLSRADSRIYLLRKNSGSFKHEPIRSNVMRCCVR